MPYSFGTTDWAETISRVSTRPEFQNALIRIVDTSLIEYGEYDIETGTQDVTGDGVVYRGRARLIPVRWGTFTGGESQANSATLSAVRIQIPRLDNTESEDFGGEPFGEEEFGANSTLTLRVKRGCKVFVETCERNPVLEDLVFNITSDLQGSMSAARTFEAALDGDVSIG